jgi:hypothetical protein
VVEVMITDYYDDDDDSTTAFENVLLTGSSWLLSYINGSVQPIRHSNKILNALLLYPTLHENTMSEILSRLPITIKAENTNLQLYKDIILKM